MLTITWHLLHAAGDRFLFKGAVKVKKWLGGYGDVRQGWIVNGELLIMRWYGLVMGL